MKQPDAKSATELFAGGASTEAWQQGRRLKLFFDGQSKPELDRAEFHANGQQGEKYGFLQRGYHLTGHSFKWTEMPQALARFFLEYLNSGLHGRRFDFRRVPQTDSLADAVSKNNSKLYTLFVEALPKGGTSERVEKIFDGDNLHGRNPGERSVCVRTDYLPPACVEVFWEGRALTKPKEVEAFTRLFLTAWKMPPLAEPKLPEGEGSKTERQVEEPGLPKPTAPPESQPGKEPEANPPLPDTAAEPKAEPKPEQPKPAESESAKKPATPETPTPAEPPEKKEPVQPEPEPEIPPARIEPKLFTVAETGHQWPDDIPLITWGQEDDPHVWTLKNAFEGVLIMGATGSGKTTGSGAAIAEAFLRQGFGGLVMTVKADEAERWRRLCEHCGRAKDFICIRRGGDSKLNVLAYEAEATGRGMGLSENLVAFCRTLLAISGRNQGQGPNDQFWQSAISQLLNATFDLFLLSGSQPTFDRLSDFIAAAPAANIPKTEEAWLETPVFGGILARAKKLAVSPEDQRILKRATGYWFNIYPGLAPKTRTSITLGVYSMLDAFRGRDIPDLISSDTNLTPESIMSGKIVVLDLPVKELGQTGLLVQSAWKYLFQTALERHARSGNPARRPVFLWEDEGQYFFSEHDHHFQATARSARVCHVVLSQNVHNFYMEFGRNGHEAANSVFGNLNTKIFHANSDPETNQWAATHFGQELRTRISVSHNPPTRRPAFQELSDNFLEALNPPSNVGVSTHEQWEYAVRPEEFNCLRTGGPENEFLVDAYMTWIGATGRNEKHFTTITFNQNPNL